MNSHALQFLTTRAETNSHTGFLGNAREQPPDPLIDKVFRHQVAIFDAPAVLQRSLGPTATLQEKLASYFYLHCYTPPTIHQGDPNGRKLQEAEFIEKVFLTNSSSHRNHLSYLLGEVGVGKTAFINSLITRYGSLWIQSKKRWFIRVDMERAGDRQPLTLEHFVYLICKKTLAVFEDNPDLPCITGNHGSNAVDCALAKLRTASGRPFANIPENERSVVYESQLKWLGTLIATMSEECDRTLLLAIDNLDYLVHHRERGLYEPDYDDSALLEAVCSVASCFVNDTTDLGSLGANVLFVMRFDTYNVLAEMPSISLPIESVWKGMHAYTIDRPYWQDVLDSRAKLLHYGVSLLEPEAKGTTYEDIIRLIETDLTTGTSPQERLIHHLECLTNYSLRGMVEFFSKYSWFSTTGFHIHSTVLKRFSEHYPLALITFMLNDRRLFGQLTSTFPNVFLASSQKADHAHTYWLKWLIIAFLHQKGKRDEHLTPDQVLGVFCEVKKRPYNKRLVQECLGSLSDVANSNVIQVRRRRIPSNKLSIDKIALTHRGLHCWTKIFPKFAYLQLIVDDPLLPIPHVVLEHFAFNAVPIDYSYIVEGVTAAFHDKARTMVQRKAFQVLLFLRILKKAAALEIEKHPMVYDNLKHHGVELPDVYRMEASIRRELRALAESELDFDLDRIEKRVRDIDFGLELELESLYGVEAPTYR